MDIVWKIITGVAALFLAVAAIFSWWNKNALGQEQALLARADSNLQATNARILETEEALKINTGGKDNAIAVRDETIQSVKETEASSSETEADIATYKNQNADLATKIASIKERIAEFGDIDQLIATVQKLQSDITAAEANVTGRTQTLDIAVAQVAGVKEEIGRYQELVSRQLSGKVLPDFKAGVASVHPTWGFAVLNKGNTDGLYQGSILQIDRGEGAVGRLHVTRVEQNRAIASFSPETWAEGDMPRPGDTVSPVLEDAPTGIVDGGAVGEEAMLPQAPGAPDPSQLLPDPAAGDMGGAADSPFGAPAAPAMEDVPAADDNPFGAAGGEEMAPPAEAPAAPDNDPFG